MFSSRMRVTGVNRLERAVFNGGPEFGWHHGRYTLVPDDETIVVRDGSFLHFGVRRE